MHVLRAAQAPSVRILSATAGITKALKLLTDGSAG